MASTTPDNIQYPVGTDQVAPLANHFKNLADSTQAALNTKPDTTELPDVITHLNAADYIKFDTTYTGGSTQPGMLNWNDTDGTLEFQLKGGNVTLQIGQEQVVRVKNDTGAALANGKAVYISGSNGVNLLASYANAGAENTSSQTIGITTEEIGSNQHGFVTTFGLVRNIDTNNLVEGAAVWLDTTNGGLTATRPAAPNHGVLLGFCLRKSATVGVVFVRVDNGWELDELHNVSITSPADKQVLAYEASSQLWKNKQATGGVTVGASAPANPNPGDAWFDSNDGTLYVWYVDTDTSQWVQVQANSALEASILARLGSLEAQAIAYGSPSINYLINGAFDIAQRGNSVSVAGNGYGIDRWTNNSNVTNTVSQQTTGVPNGSNYVVRVAPASSGVTNFYQMMETLNAKQLWGKTITFSGKIRRNASLTQNMAVAIEKSSTVDAGLGAAWTNIGSFALTNSLMPTGTTSADWYSFSVTVAIPADGTANTLRFGINSGTLPTGAYYELAQMQVEAGSTTTSFRRNQPNIQAELAACQRYYWRLASGAYNNTYFGAASFWANQSFYCPLIFPVPMRATPTGSISSLSHLGVLALNTNMSVTDLVATGTSAQGGFYSGVASAGSAGQSGTLWLGSGTGGWIEFKAEL